MANPRKVQTEIDKLMKKVQEGMDVYESTFEKVNSAPDRMQKEKFEAELKKEIKKLQRLREQIKALHANPEVKDKKQLEVTRRAIEVKMEGFKVCERETKTKAFSKEGLAASKSDPAARAKAKTTGWINNSIQELQDQIEQIEFDIENEAAQPAVGKKKKGTEDERAERIKRCLYHILKLESILRVLEMGELEPEDVDEIEPDVQAFVEGWQDPTYEEDLSMDIYEMFDIPEGMVQAIGSHIREESDSEVEGDAASKEAKKEAAAPAKVPPAKVAAPPKEPTPKPAAKPSPAKQAAPAPLATAAPAIPTPVKAPTTPLSAAKVPGSPINPPPGKSMAAIVAGHRDAEKKDTPLGTPLATHKTPPQAGAKLRDRLFMAPSGEEAGLLDDGDENNDDTFGDDAMVDVKPGSGSLAEMATMTSTKLGGGDWAKPLPATVAGTAPASAATANVLSFAPSLPPASPTSPKLQQQAAQAVSSSVPPPRTAASPMGQAQPQLAPAAPLAPPVAVAPQPTATTTSGARQAPSTETIQRMLAMSLRNLPNTSDCERPKPYTPPNPYATPEYYPQTVHPAFNSPETFASFNVDTLFFIFYYQQASYQQYLAAKELKRQSWRFHKKFQTWFQRHDRPKLTTDEHEQGTYIYFDYDGGWCQRIKSDFVFRYAHLEDSLV